MIKSKNNSVIKLAASCIGALFLLSNQSFAQSAKIGSEEITDAYVRATAPGQEVAGGFMKIQNKGSTPDQLISASSPAAGDVQLHEMAMEGNVMKMRQLKEIPIPAGGTVELKHGGLHLMFLNLKGPFTAGETIPVKLKFAKAGEVEMKFPVDAISVKHGKH